MKSRNTTLIALTIGLITSGFAPDRQCQQHLLKKEQYENARKEYQKLSAETHESNIQACVATAQCYGDSAELNEISAECFNKKRLLDAEYARANAHSQMWDKVFIVMFILSGAATMSNLLIDKDKLPRGSAAVAMYVLLKILTCSAPMGMAMSVGYYLGREAGERNKLQALTAQSIHETDAS